MVKSITTIHELVIILPCYTKGSQLSVSIHAFTPNSFFKKHFNIILLYVLASTDEKYSTESGRSFSECVNEILSRVLHVTLRYMCLRHNAQI
jgi:hypothetical protein